MTTSTIPDRPALRADDTNDLGFGTVVSSQSRQRLLNKDGSFNVRRRGLAWYESHSAYHTAIGMTWPRFLWVCAGVYLAINIVFAIVYLVCGTQSLSGVEPAAMGGLFGRAFFFSVETFATIGYGTIVPVGVAAHVVMVVEALVALMSQALITGLLFARFARPTAAIRFSSRMLIAPFHGGRALMFRVVNTRDNQLIDLEARVNCSWIEPGGTGAGRKFTMLTLERANVMLFPLAWTIVHPITPESPLWGLSADDLRAGHYEILAMISGTEETFAQPVHARSSYVVEEMVWGAKFRHIFNPPDEQGMLSVDVHRLDEYDVVALPV
jgi:inward rectifier potassium channel